jgi:hypothetical protein
MKKLAAILIACIPFCGCQKPVHGPQPGCTSAEVTLTAPSCKKVGVIIDGTKYPSDDLPDQYAVEGKNICIEYSFWEDQTKCMCCGGKKVHIIAVH